MTALLPPQHLQHFREFFRNVCRRDGRHAGVVFLFAVRAAAGAAGIGALDEGVAARERAVDGGARRAPEGERRRADGLGDVEGAGVACEQQRDEILAQLG